MFPSRTAAFWGTFSSSGSSKTQPEKRFNHLIGAVTSKSEFKVGGVGRDRRSFTRSRAEESVGQNDLYNVTKFISAQSKPADMFVVGDPE